MSRFPCFKNDADNNGGERSVVEEAQRGKSRRGNYLAGEKNDGRKNWRGKSQGKIQAGKRQPEKVPVTVFPYPYFIIRKKSPLVLNCSCCFQIGRNFAYVLSQIHLQVQPQKINLTQPNGSQSCQFDSYIMKINFLIIPSLNYFLENVFNTHFVFLFCTHT